MWQHLGVSGEAVGMLEQPQCWGGMWVGETVRVVGLDGSPVPMAHTWVWGCS